MLHARLLFFLSRPGGIARNAVVYTFKQHCILNMLDGTNDDNVWQHDSDKGRSKSE